MAELARELVRELVRGLAQEQELVWEPAPERHNQQ